MTVSYTRQVQPLRITLAQVVLGQSKKDPNVYVAMKVVYLQSPEVLDDPEHLAILRK